MPPVPSFAPLRHLVDQPSEPPHLKHATAAPMLQLCSHRRRTPSSDATTSCQSPITRENPSAALHRGFFSTSGGRQYCRQQVLSSDRSANAPRAVTSVRHNVRDVSPSRARGPHPAHSFAGQCSVADARFRTKPSERSIHSCTRTIPYPPSNPDGPCWDTSARQETTGYPLDRSDQSPYIQGRL